jgi:hypothetical protein
MSDYTASAVMAPQQEPPPELAQGRQYLYAVIFASDRLPEASAGIDGLGVHKIAEGQIAAVAGGAPTAKIRPERRHLAAHQEVLKQLLASTTPLPMSFGTIADSPEAVRQFLFKHGSALFDQLSRVAGKVEMGLRVSWEVSNIFEYFVNKHADLRQARDHLLAGPRHPTQDEKIEVGRMFEHHLQDDRARHTEKVERILAAAGVECKANKSRAEREVMNLACLVARGRQEAFGQAVVQAAQLFDHDFTFDYNGPWAPHNFVEIEPL